MAVKYNNGVVYLTPEIAHFKKCGDFLGLELSGDLDALTESTLDIKRQPSYDRVRIRRTFPFSLADKYVSVLDNDQNEIGLIEDVSIFPEDEAELIRAELERVYFCPEITKIVSVRERLGYAYFSVVTDAGEREIPLRDVYRSIIRVSDDRIVLIDIDGNRYSVSSLKALDRNSMKKLEMYL